MERIKSTPNRLAAASLLGLLMLSGCGDDLETTPSKTVTYNEDGTMYTHFPGNEFPDRYSVCEGNDLVDYTEEVDAHDGGGGGSQRSANHEACDDGMLVEGEL